MSGTEIIILVVLIVIFLWPIRNSKQRALFLEKQRKKQAEKNANVTGEFEMKRMSGFRILLFGPLGMLVPKKDKVQIRKPPSNDNEDE